MKQSQSTHANSVQTIIEKLGSGDKMPILELKSENIGDMEVQALASALRHNKSVKRIYFRNNKINEISDASAQALADALRENAGLKFLELSDNEIDITGVQVLADVLREKIDLGTLVLCGNSRNDASLGMPMQATIGRILADTLQHSTSLRKLDLSGSALSDASVEALAGALQQSTSLRELDLSRSVFGDVGVKALADGLRKNTKLRVLKLDDNSISSEGVESLVSALQQNYVLTTLSLEGNKIYKNSYLKCVEKHEEQILSLDDWAEDLESRLNTLQQTMPLLEGNKESYLDFIRKLEIQASLDQLLARNRKIAEVKKKLKAFIEGSSIDNQVLDDIPRQYEALENFIKEEKLSVTHYFSELYRLSSAVLSLYQVVSSESSVDEIKFYEKALSLLMQPFHHCGLQLKAHDRLKDCLVQLLRLTADSDDQNEKDKHAAYATLLAYHLRHNRQDLAFGLAMYALNPEIDIAASLEKFMIFDDLVVIAKKVLNALTEKQKTTDVSQNDPDQKEREILSAIIQRGNYHHAAVTALFSLPFFVKALDAENIKALYLLEACLIDPSREGAMNYSLGVDQNPEVLFKYLTGVADQYAIEIQKPDRFEEILDEAKRVAVPNLNLEEKIVSPTRGIGMFDEVASSSANSNSASSPRPM
ncbi:MAG: hypothetical protein A2W47_00810 [Gammaproteobacteria bacterium RIFCSPHIGHO2_12_38_15]|nr:MAG: hypothetical protein A2W47_00810 [Gammaproteobacteria bacterium RIFCSPHIGHO2_12_38_15]